jgi:hypothetical protein
MKDEDRIKELIENEEYITGIEAMQIAQVTFNTIRNWIYSYGIGEVIGGGSQGKDAFYFVNINELNKVLNGTIHDEFIVPQQIKSYYKVILMSNINVVLFSNIRG